MKPLNGENTHPLSAKALAAIEAVRRNPTPAQELNPGILNRLLRTGDFYLVQMPSTYKSHNGKPITFIAAKLAGDSHDK